MVVLYGTETGTAQEVAEDTAERLGGACESLATYDARRLASEGRCVALVVATAGQGEIPRGARPFWSFLLQKRLPPGSLGHVRFAVCGLGDSSYPHFNYAAKKLDARLAQLGAVRLAPPLLADTAELGRAVRRFQTSLWAALGGQGPLPQLPLLPAECGVNCEWGEMAQDDDWEPQGMAEVVERRAESDGVTRVVVRAACVPGDVLEVWPAADVSPLPAKRLAGRLVRDVSTSELLERLGYNARRRVVCEGKWWSGATLGGLARHVLDLFGPVTRDVLRVCAHYSSLEQQELRERLCDLAAHPWSEETRDYTHAELRSVAEVICDFTPRNIPVGRFVAMLRERLSRSYSIAHCSSSSAALLVSDVQSSSPGGRVRLGQASASLLSPGVARLRVRVAPGKLSSVELGEAALLVVAGTGLAAVTSVMRPSHWLVQGCRHAQLEQSFLASFPNVHLALSRADPSDKVYVWHILLRRAADVYGRFLAPESGGKVVMAGSVSSGFARDVLSALQTVYKQHTGATQEQALAYFKTMESQGRLLLDVWG